MNSYMREQYPLFEMYQAMRSQLMEILTDEDLTFAIGGENLDSWCVMPRNWRDGTKLYRLFQELSNKIFHTGMKNLV